jgi:hypothetical protein
MAKYLGKRAQDRQDILHFTLDCIEAEAAGKVQTSDLFQAYKRWRLSKGMAPTHISVDSFGALLPETLTHSVIWVDGKTQRGLTGIVVRE